VYPSPMPPTNAGRDGGVICCGYRIISGMCELAALQGGINQIVTEYVSGDNYGHHIPRPGRQKTDAVKARLVILAEAIEFRRRVHAVTPAYHPLAAWPSTGASWMNC
jgi:hypothetical protein